MYLKLLHLISYIILYIKINNKFSEMNVILWNNNYDRIYNLINKIYNLLIK